MTDKTISSSNPFMWWGYILHRLFNECIPLQISLCKLFWVNVATTAVIGSVGFLLRLLVFLVILDWISFLVGVGVVVGVAFVCFLIIRTAVRFDEAKEGEITYTVKQYLKDRKSSFCPIYRVQG